MIVNYVPRRQTASGGFVSSLGHEILLPVFWGQKSTPFLQSCLKYRSSLLSYYYFSNVSLLNEAILQNERSIEENHVIRVCLSHRKTRSLLCYIQIRHLYLLNQNWVILQCFEVII